MLVSDPGTGQAYRNATAIALPITLRLICGMAVSLDALAGRQNLVSDLVTKTDLALGMADLGSGVASQLDVFKGSIAEKSATVISIGAIITNCRGDAQQVIKLKSDVEAERFLSCIVSNGAVASSRIAFLISLALSVADEEGFHSGVWAEELYQTFLHTNTPLLIAFQASYGRYQAGISVASLSKGGA